MSWLEGYANKYRNVTFTRRDGILEMRLHSQGGPMKWAALETSVHEQLGYAFYDVAHDPENRVVIITGTGDHFCENFDFDELVPEDGVSPAYWDRIFKESKDLLMNLLDIDVPVIGAVNGPALIHAELAVMSDIVLASDTAVFADLAHFTGGQVPGDGVHSFWQMLLGPNRGRVFLMTGQKIAADEALKLGIVAEVLPPDRLLARAWEIAEELAKKPTLTLRYTRIAFTQHLKRRLLDDLGYGLIMEGMGVVASGGYK